MRPLGRGLATSRLDEGGWSFSRTASHISRVDVTISSCRWNWDLGSYLSQQVHFSSRSLQYQKALPQCNSRSCDIVHLISICQNIIDLLNIVPLLHLCQYARPLSPELC
ncbi:hypothetical protein TNCV_535751 [Trichonephila clavipes]|nr:hypothetical protein TNCV_535751 [Trichonephila clavipes]